MARQSLASRNQPLRVSAIMHDLRRVPECVGLPQEQCIAVRWRGGDIGSLQAASDQIAVPVVFGSERFVPRCLPPRCNAAMRNGQSGLGETRRTEQCRRIAVHDIGVLFGCQSSDPLCRFPHRGGILRQPVESASGIDDPCPRLTDVIYLIGRGRRTKRGEQDLVAGGHQRTGEVRGILPDAADRIGGHQYTQLPCGHNVATWRAVSTLSP